MLRPPASSHRVNAVLTGVLLLALAGPTGAPAASIEAPRTLTLRAGTIARLTAQIPDTSTCALALAGRRATVDTRDAISVTFTFRVAKRPRVRSARARLRCTPGPAARIVTVRVRHPRRGTRALISGGIRARVTGAPDTGGGDGAMTWERAHAQAQRDWDAMGPGFLALFAGTGQCTDWAAQRRPDVIAGAKIALWTMDYLHVAHAPENWDGGYWDDTARAAGTPVTSSPTVGAVIVFDPGAMGAGAVGHVGIVEAVNPDGSFAISEMNAPVPGQVSSRSFPATAAGEPGVSFLP